MPGPLDKSETFCLLQSTLNNWLNTLVQLGSIGLSSWVWLALRRVKIQVEPKYILNKPIWSQLMHQIGSDLPMTLRVQNWVKLDQFGSLKVKKSCWFELDWGVGFNESWRKVLLAQVGSSGHSAFVLKTG